MSKSKCKIAMWSYPRSTSTALMRSFSSRDDVYSTDEPFYGYFLNKSQIKHPNYKETIKNSEIDYFKISENLSNIIPENKSVWYQKHMAHHIFEEDSLKWINNVSNCFLIRDPMKIIISYSKIYPDMTPELLGFPQMLRIFNYVKNEIGEPIPFVINSSDLLLTPNRILGKLCEHLKILYSDSMLSWKKENEKTLDGWTKNWYDSVNKSTTFKKPKNENIKLPKKYHKLYEECLEYFNILYQYRVL